MPGLPGDSPRQFLRPQLASLQACSVAQGQTALLELLAAPARAWVVTADSAPRIAHGELPGPQRRKFLRRAVAALVIPTAETLQGDKHVLDVAQIFTLK